MVKNLGVGSAPIPRKKLTADKLAAAIREATNAPDMREKAAELAQKIAAEDGVAAACEFVQRYLSKQHKERSSCVS